MKLEEKFAAKVEETKQDVRDRDAGRAARAASTAVENPARCDSCGQARDASGLVTTVYTRMIPMSEGSRATTAVQVKYTECPACLMAKIPPPLPEPPKAQQDWRACTAWKTEAEALDRSHRVEYQTGRRPLVSDDGSRFSLYPIEPTRFYVIGDVPTVDPAEFKRHEVENPLKFG